MIKKFKNFILNYFGEKYLRRSFFIAIGIFGMFLLNKVSDYLSYHNQMLANLNTDLNNNYISILKVN